MPFAAITGYATEGLQVAIGQEYPLVVLTFLTAEGPKELPLLARTGLPGVHRFEYADALRQLLHQSIEAPQGARVPEVAVG